MGTFTARLEPVTYVAADGSQRKRLINVGGGTLYYKATEKVSPSSNDGSLAPNEDVVIEAGVYVCSDAGTTAVTVMDVDELEAVDQQLDNLAIFNVKDYGAKGNGVADDTKPLLRAREAASRAGGGTVEIPAGEYITAPMNWTGDKVRLRGASKFATTIKLKNSSNTHAIKFDGNGNAVEHLTVDANRANQSTGHGIRWSGEGNTFEHLRVLNTKTYGLAAQEGFVKGTVINDLYLDEIGRDGIDIKDHENKNEANFITNVTINRSGINGANGEAAIDLRGRWQVSNVAVLSVTGENTAIRFREGDEGNTGYGCEGSSLTNFRVKVSSTATLASGLFCASPDVNISNGYIDLNGGVGTGVTAGTRNKVTNVTVVNGTNASGGTGFWQPSGQKRLEYIGCIARKCRKGFLMAGEEASIIGGATEECSVHGVDPSGSSGLTIDGLRYFSNTADLNFTSINAAEELVLPSYVDDIAVAGASEIKKIAASRRGRIVVLRFSSTPKMVDGSNLELNGNLEATAGTTWTGYTNGTNWREIARSKN